MASYFVGLCAIVWTFIGAMILGFLIASQTSKRLTWNYDGHSHMLSFATEQK